MESSKYNRRTWLNPETSHFTGSVVCHDGVVSNQGRPEERYTFLELSSCHGKIKLHADMKNDGEKAIPRFITKLCKLGDEIDRFITHLEMANLNPEHRRQIARVNDSQDKLLAQLEAQAAVIEKLQDTINALSAELEDRNGSR